MTELIINDKHRNNQSSFEFDTLLIDLKELFINTKNLQDATLLKKTENILECLNLNEEGDKEILISCTPRELFIFLTNIIDKLEELNLKD